MKKNVSSTFRRPRLHRFALEARQLFDGAAIAETVQHADASSDASHDSTHDTFRPVTVDTTVSAQPAVAKEVFVIDSQIKNWQSLVAQLPQNSKVVVLNEGSSGLSQLNQALAGETQISAIHIYSHGASDEITLGTDIITAQNVSGLQSQLQSLGDKMTADGDILLYGCSITREDTALIGQLATYTHADIAASSDATGSRSEGGNWVLETTVGDVESHTLALNYDGLLETPTLTHTTGDLIVSEPSVLTAGKEVGHFSGWTLDQSNPSGTVILNLYLQDASKGTLSDPSNPGDSNFLSFSGTAAQAQAWLNQLTFTAADRELGSQADSTGVDIYVFNDSGGSTWQTQRIIITPSNDPATINDSSLLVPERNGSGTVIGSTVLSIIDPELAIGAQTAAQMVYSLTALPSYGYLTLNGQRIGVGSVFTQQDVINGSFKYVHTATGADQNKTDNFSASLNDGATPINQSAHVTVTLNIQPENQPPTVSGSGIVFEGQPQNADLTGNVGQYITATTGGDPQDTSLTLTITQLPAHGKLYYNGQPIAVGFSFDYANKDLLTYSNDGAEGIKQDTFGVRVTDQGGGTGTPTSTDGTVTLTVDSVNDNPIFDNNSSKTAIVGAGSGSVVLTPAMLNATDVDSDDSQVSFVVNTQNMNHGYLTLNGLRLQDGDTFSVADVKAGRVSYVQYSNPAANEQDSFDFQVIDHNLNLYWSSTGATNLREGGVYDGNEPGYKLTNFRFTITLADNVSNPLPGNVPTLNQPPVTSISPVFGTDVNDPNALNHGALSEGGTLVLSGTGKITDATPGLSYTLPNVDPKEVVYTWVGPTAGGAGLAVQKNVGGSWVTLLPLETFTQADINAGNVRFAHDGGENFTFTASFTVSAGRVTLDANGQPVPVIVREDVKVFVTPVNDLPTISGSSNNVLTEGATLTITRGMLTVSDPDDANSGNPYENSTTLNGQTNYALNNTATGADALKIAFKTLPTGGSLQYFNGSSWVTITTADLNTLKLDASLLTNDSSSRLRFVSDGSEVRNTAFSVVAIDRWGAQSLTAASVGLVITNVNDGPQIATTPTAADPVVTSNSPNQAGGAPVNNPLTVVESGYGRITSAMLQAYDPDSSAVQVQYTITQSPASGRLARSTDGVNFNVLGAGSSFSQQDIANGYIYYLNDGVDRTSSSDGFTFRISDGDKEQSGNQFVINITPANDAPTVSGTGSVIRVGAGATAVTGFTVADPDIIPGATNVTDSLQTTVRLLHADGSAFSKAEYSDVVFGVASGSGATVTGGSGDLLVITGTVAQINSALAGLTVAFSQDHNALYQIQVITDDRLSSTSANGGQVNEVVSPAFGSQPTPVDSKTYNWYSDAVPVKDGNIAASSSTLLASSVNDPGILSGTAQKTANEDQATWIGGGFVVSDVESNAFGLPVTVTLSVAQGMLGIGGAGTQTSVNGVSISGDNSGTLVLTGKASDIQNLLNNTTQGLTYLSALNANHDQNGSAAGDVTLNVHLDTQASTIGTTQGAAPADLNIAINIVPVNDAPVVHPGTTIINLNNTIGNGFTTVPGFSVDDPDITDSGGIAVGETDHLRVTVRLTDMAGTPLLLADYRGNTTISIQSAATNTGVTVIATGAPPTDGDRSPIVIEGTQKQINDWLAQLQVKITGLDSDDADQYYQVQVIADDRNRAANGSLTGFANGGQNSNATNTGVIDAPLTEIDPYAVVPTGLTQNVSVAAMTVFQSSVNDAAEVKLGSNPTLSVDEGKSTVSLPAITVTDVDAGSSTLTVNVRVPNGFIISGVGGSGGTVSGVNGAIVHLTGTLSEINSRLAALTVSLPDVAGNATAADWNGSFDVVVEVNDGGATGNRPTTLPSNMTSATSDPGRADYADPTSAAIITTRQYTFTVNAVNDAPVATGTHVDLPAITEDTLAANVPGTSVGSLFGPLFDDSLDVVDNSGNGANPGTGTHSDAFWGVAITSLTLNAKQGEWQYSTDGGLNWTAVGARSDNNALFLNGSAQLRFVPAANFFGAPNQLGVRLVENDTNNDTSSTSTFPVNGGTGNTSVHGGTSLFSSQVVTLGQTINNVNDSPTITSGNWTFPEDSNTTTTLGQLLDGNYSDQLDNQTGITGGGNASQGLQLIAIYGDTTDSSKGHWEYQLGDGSWSTLPTNLSETQALILSRDTQMRFIQLPDYNGPVSGGLQLRVSDSTDPALVGGSGVYSRVNFFDYASVHTAATNHWSATAQLGVVITAVKDIANDSFSIHAGKTLTFTAVDLFANDSFENSGRSITSFTPPSNGTLTRVGDTFTYQPKAGYVGADSFTYTVTSGGVTETATVTIDVTNKVPVAVDDTRTLNEDSTTVTGNLLSNDLDGDGDPLILTGVTINGTNHAPGTLIALDGNQGTLRVNGDGTYSYTPGADWNGKVTVGYTVSDGNMGGTAQGTLTLTVTPVADVRDDVYIDHAGKTITSDVMQNDTFSNADRKVTSVTQPTHGTVTLLANNQIQYVPQKGFVGNDSYTYTVTSGGVTETATVTVIMTNQAPNTNNFFTTTPEDTNATGNILNTLSDPDNDPLQVTGFIINNASYNVGARADISGVGTFIIDAQGNYTFTPVGDWNGKVPTVNITVSDGNMGGTNTASLDISVTPVADIVNDSATTHAGTKVIIDALANDSFENSGKTITATSTPQHGSVSIVGNKLVYTPVKGYVGSDSFTYTVTSGGVTETATVVVSMTNTAPTSREVNISTAEDTVLRDTVLSWANDIDGDTLTLTGFTLNGVRYTPGQTAVVEAGSLTMNSNGSWVFTPAADWNGNVPLATYTLSDGNTGTTTSDLRISVIPVADAVNDSATTHTDDAIIIPVINNDKFSDKQRITLTAGRPVAGSIMSVSDNGGTVQVLSDNTVRYQPPANFVGTDTFTYTVTSYTGVTETATVSILVTNSRPGAANDQKTGPEDASLSGRFNATDPDNDVLKVVSFSANGQTLLMGNDVSKTLTLSGVGTLVVNADMTWTFTPVADWNGTVPQIAYTVTDGHPNGNMSGTLTLIVTPVVDIHDDRVTLHAGQTDTRNLLANDTFSNSDRKVTSVTQGQHGSVRINADGTVSYSPVASYVGQDTYTYTVTSGGVTETATVYVDIINTPPVIPAQTTLTGPEDTTLSGSVLRNASDADATDTLSVVSWNLPGETRPHSVGVPYAIPGIGVFTLQANGQFTFVPVADWNGSVPMISYSVTDGHSNGLVSGLLNLVITPVVDIHADTVSLHSGSGVVIDVLKNDKFSNPDQTIVALGKPLHGQATIQNGRVTYLADAGYVGNDSFTYTVLSGGKEETATITLNVFNSKPQTQPDVVIRAEDTPVTGNVLSNDQDPDGDVIRVQSFTVLGQTYQAGTRATLAGIGSIILQRDGSYTFTPVADWNGAVPDIRYTATDGNSNGQVSNVLRMTLTPVQDAFNDSASTHAGVSVLTDVLANDTFSNAQRQITSFSQGAHGTVALENGQLRYSPVAGYVGTDTYTYTVTSGGVTETATVTVTLTNRLPTSADFSLATAEDSPLSGNVMDRAGDKDGDPLTLTQFSIGNQTFSAGQTATIAAGTLVMRSDGSWMFTPAADWNGAVPPVRFTLSDGNNGGVTSSLLNIGVVPVGDTRSDYAVAHSDDPIIIPVLDNDTFTTPHGSLTLTAGTPVAGSLFSRTDQGGQVRVLSDNTVQYLPPDGYTGIDSFSYTVTTPDGHQEVGNVTIAVLNGTPTAQQTALITPEDTAQLVGHFNAVDADGDVLSLVSVTINNVTTTLNGNNDRQVDIPGVGTLHVFANLDFTFTPVADWNGVVPQITYTVTDGNNNGTTDGTLFIVVTPEIDAHADSYTMHAGQSDRQSPLDNDTFSNADRTISSVTQGQHGRVEISQDGQHIIYTPDPAFVGQDVYSYTVTSGGRTEVAFVSVTVTDTRPVLTPLAPVSGPEDSVLSGNVIDNVHDADPTDTLNVVSWNLPGESRPHLPGVAYTIPGQGTFTLNADGRYTFVPVADWNGSVPTITFVVSDGHDGGQVSGELNLTVTPVVDIQSDYVRVHAGQPLIIDALANDSFSNSDKQIVATGNALHGQVTIQNGKITYLPNAGYVGMDTFTYTVVSGGVSETATITVEVWNNAPQPRPDRAVVAEDTVARGNLLANDRDSDGDTLRVVDFRIGTLAGVFTPGATVAIAGVGEITLQANGDYLFRPVADWNGDVPQIIYTVSDGNQNGLASQTFNLSVSPVVDAHQDLAFIHSSFPGTIDVLANDSFSNPNATIVGVSTPHDGAVSIVNGKVVYTPRPGYVGYDSFSYTVRSGGVEETATVVVWVTNQTPVAHDVHAQINEDSGTLQGSLPVTDADNDALRITGFNVDGDANRYDVPANGSRTVTIAGKGVLTITSDRQFTFRPFADWNGTVPLVHWQVTDGNDNGTTGGTLAIVVNPVVDGMADQGVLLKGGDLTMDVLANDTFSDPNRQITAVSQGAHGSVTLLADGRIHYVPRADYVGTDSYTYTVTSGGVTETVTVQVLVKPVLELTVYEAGLRDGNAASHIASGSLQVSAFDPAQSITINGKTFTLAQLQQFTSQRPGNVDFGFGHLEITRYQAIDASHGVLSYRYVQTQAVAHHDSQPIQITFSFTVNGEIGGVLHVNIIDDAPHAQPDTADIYQDRAQYNQSGNLFTNDTIGADSAAKGGPVVEVASQNSGRTGQVNGVTVGEFGVLRLDANGNWHYEVNRNNPRVASLDANASLQEVFVYTIEDADGNTSQATLTVVIHGTTAMPLVADRDGWHDLLFDRPEEATASRLSFTPGLFILPMIYDFESQENTHAIRVNYRLAMLGYGIEHANAPVLEQAVLFPRWFTDTRHPRDIRESGGNGLGQNLLRDAFSPFSIRHVEEREKLSAPAAPEKPQPVASIQQRESAQGALSLTAQLAALHRPAPDKTIVLPAMPIKQTKS